MKLLTLLEMDGKDLAKRCRQRFAQLGPLDRLAVGINQFAIAPQLSAQRVQAVRSNDGAAT